MKCMVSGHFVDHTIPSYYSYLKCTKFNIMLMKWHLLLVHFAQRNNIIIDRRYDYMLSVSICYTIKLAKEIG